MVPVGNDTLLRVVRRRAQAYAEPLEVVGIDDWAMRRNHRYGTIVCDLNKRRVVTLLPDREVGTVAAWLKAMATFGSSRATGAAGTAKQRPVRCLMRFSKIEYLTAPD
jgi:hypothetical protein